MSAEVRDLGWKLFVGLLVAAHLLEQPLFWGLLVFALVFLVGAGLAEHDRAVGSEDALWVDDEELG